MTRSQTSGGFEGGSGTFLFRLSGTFNLMGGRGVPETCQCCFFEVMLKEKFQVPTHRTDLPHEVCFYIYIHMNHINI